MIGDPAVKDRPSRAILLGGLVVAALSLGWLVVCDAAHAQRANNPAAAPQGRAVPPPPPPSTPQGETRLPDLNRDLGLPELAPAPIEAAPDESELLLLVPRGGVPGVANDYGLPVLAQAPLQSLGQDMLLTRPPAGLSALEAIALIEVDPRVVLVQLNQPYELQRDMAPAALAAEAARPGSVQEAQATGVTIGLIDSAVDIRHPAFEGAAIELVDVVGAPFVKGDAVHGTAMAGAILGSGEARGEARGAQLLAIRAFAAGGTGRVRSASYPVALAIDLAITEEVDVLNMSFAGKPDRLVAKLLDQLASTGILAVGAAGNAGPEAPPAYPAAHPAVLAVTAVDGKDRIFDKANRGAYIGLAAAGVDVIIAGPGGAYGISSGTSIAAARVSGLAATILAQAKGLRPAALDGLLRETAIDLGPSGPDESFGAGKVDPPAARAAARQTAGLKDG